MTIKPTAIESRLSEIDVLRGFALFGVLLVNLTMIDSTLFGPAHFSPSGSYNFYAKTFIEFFAQGKFYTLFSFLFGLGFYFFISRNQNPLILEKAYKRRLNALLLFGCLHLIFVWFGDILHSYAICGYILYLNRNRSSRSLLIAAFSLGMFSLILYGMLYAGGPSSFDYQTAYSSALDAYTSKHYFSMVWYRITSELPIVFQNVFIVTPKLLSLFFLGFYMGKKEVFKHLSEHHSAIKRLCVSSGILFAITLFTMFVVIKSGFTGGWINGVSKELGTYAGSCFYVTLILLSLKHPLIRKILSPLQFSGRMALTNYLVQTVFWTTFFYGYGAGQFGKIQYIYYLPLAFAFYSGQIVLSWFWLKTFKYGPAEWIWRKWTYGNL